MEQKDIIEWEYEYIDTILGSTVYSGGMKSLLKLYGSQGWELVAVAPFLLFFATYYFKRPKQQP